MSNRVADKVINLRRIWQNRILGYAQLSREQRRKREESSAGGREQFYRESFTGTGWRENKLDTGEDRMSQRTRRSQKIRTDCWSWYEAKQSSSATDPERSQIESVSLERNLSWTAELNQSASTQKELERGAFIQQWVSEAEDIVGLDYVVQRLEASKTRPRLADGSSKPWRQQLY